MSNDYFDESKKSIDTILKVLVQSIPEDEWDRIKFNISFFKDETDTTYSGYQSNASYFKAEIEKSFTVDQAMIAYPVGKLWGLNTSKEKGELKGLEFILTPKKFDIDYKY